MTDPDETARLVDQILQGYREHAAAEENETEEAETEDLEDDPDCE